MARRLVASTGAQRQRQGEARDRASCRLRFFAIASLLICAVFMVWKLKAAIINDERNKRNFMNHFFNFNKNAGISSERFLLSYLRAKKATE